MHAIISINNSESQITGLTAVQFKELKKLLSYKIDDNAAFFGGRSWNPYRTLLGRRGDFPTGLLYLVRRFISDNAINAQFIDVRTEPKGHIAFNLKLPYAPHVEQLDAATEAILRKRGTISAVTAFGKSAIIALIVKALGLKTLIVVTNLGLKAQLQESFLSYFGSLDNIAIENIDSPKLKQRNHYDLLIVDEAHHSAATTYRMLNKKFWNGIFYRFFLTATAFRAREEEQMLMESVAGQVIYRIDYKKAVAKKYVTPVEAYYFDLPRKNVEGFTWAEVYKELIVDNTDRNRLIASLLQKLQDKSTICLVKEIRHGANIQVEMLPEPPFVKGENDDNTELFGDFNSGNEKLLIATNGVAGEGVDLRPTEYVIIAGLGKSKPQFMQQVGRGLRKHPGKTSCKIILFRDCSNKWTLTHFKAQCKILREEYGVDPVKLELF